MAPPNKFKFFAERTVKRDFIEFTISQSITMRNTLPKGIYWLQLAKGGGISWNYTLLSSYLRNGMDSPEHQALLAEYEASLDKPEPTTTPSDNHE